MSWKVAVPTYDHAPLIGQQTLALIEQARVEHERVCLFVADEQERALYAAAVPAWEERLIVTAPGLMASRKLGHAYFAAGEQVVWMDDDVRGLYRLGADQELRPVDLRAVAEEGFRAAARTGAHLWGIYPVHNAFFMRARIRADLSYIIGCFYGTVIRHEEELHPRLGDPKEDYERTLRYWQRDGVLARLDYICPATAYYRPGPKGDRLGRTVAVVEANIAAIERQWPAYVRRARTKRYGFPEMRLVGGRQRALV
ncbi:MAG TPA: hypothetical protein VH834_18185 [Solirubrobacteraceae bacterium]|jgi:hypothetical protein